MKPISHESAFWSWSSNIENSWGQDLLCKEVLKNLIAGLSVHKKWSKSLLVYYVDYMERRDLPDELYFCLDRVYCGTFW